MYIEKIMGATRVIRDNLGSNASSMGYNRLILDVENYAPDIRNKIVESKNNELLFLNKIIENGITKKEIRDDLDGELLAVQFQCLQEGIVLKSRFNGNLNELYKNLDKVLNQLYKLVKK